MKVRRCSTLFVELDSKPRFDFESLLMGGDGMVRSPRWLAYATHRDAPVPVSLPQLAVLEGVSAEQWSCWDTLLDTHAIADLQHLLDAELLLSDGEQHQAASERDRGFSDVPWWPPAAIAHSHGRWADNDIQGRVEQGIGMSSEQMLSEFGAPPGHDYRRGQQPLLPLPDGQVSDLDTRLAQRRTCRNFCPHSELSLDALATMLRRSWATMGTLEMAPDTVAVKKNAPAGGGLHCIEAYVLVQRVAGLSPGLYHYVCAEHALEPLALGTAEQARWWAHRFVSGQSWFVGVAAMVLMTARYDRLFWKYRRHTKAWRVTHLDAGHLSQLMYLSAAELGLGAFITAAINERAIEQALGLQSWREGAVAAVGFGPPAETLETMEMRGFTPSALAQRIQAKVR
ncbi:putative peptide maturation dehydrogenase [Pseudomarimonas arenosa]|uniref:Peptide maturation dehydrogenase n=1 Tax=Pseudomarimonas arenosa TaxID=2774145 RepID=A0AAW3ZIF0_9GAMM|nr:putative peptide maturation dehydrogenase [Pseudomarimonas arenosa]MBD8525778.1 putative peptide maturation dehydrogenase [Pseudomarimonas arenosa]